jgi:MoxR-like ATPase
MSANAMNLPPISVAGAKAALIEQFADPVLRQRATMLWGTRGVGKSSIVRQVAAHFGVPLVDLRLTTIEPVDLRGAIYADDEQRKTVWFPPEFLPTRDVPAGILFLDELTAADQRLQISAYSLILDRRVGHYPPAPLPAREAQTLLMELLMQKALQGGLELAVLENAAYRRYMERRHRDGLDG